jgi:hypothetical protein
MLQLCLRGFPALGIVVLVIEIALWLKNHKRGNPEGGVLRIYANLFGAVLAVASLFIRYPLGHHYMIHGFPIPLVVFERTQRIWTDYVSSGNQIIFGIIINGLALGLIPQFWLWRRLRKLK